VPSWPLKWSSSPKKATDPFMRGSFSNRYSAVFDCSWCFTASVRDLEPFLFKLQNSCVSSHVARCFELLLFVSRTPGTLHFGRANRAHSSLTNCSALPFARRCFKAARCHWCGVYPSQLISNAQETRVLVMFYNVLCHAFLDGHSVDVRFHLLPLRLPFVAHKSMHGSRLCAWLISLLVNF